MLKRIRKISGRPCLNPAHNPPGHIVLEPGEYEHTCPGCKKVTVFRVNGSYSWNLEGPGLLTFW